MRTLMIGLISSALIMSTFAAPGAHAFGRGRREYAATLTTLSPPGAGPGVGAPPDCTVIRDLNAQARALISEIEAVMESVIALSQKQADATTLAELQSDLRTLSKLQEELTTVYPPSLDRVDRVLRYSWTIDLGELGSRGKITTARLGEAQEFLDRLNLNQLYSISTERDEDRFTVSIDRPASPVAACLNDNRFLIVGLLHLELRDGRRNEAPIRLLQARKHWYWPWQTLGKFPISP